jgi:uncharacterized protein (DUF1330 family)
VDINSEQVRVSRGLLNENQRRILVMVPVEGEPPPQHLALIEWDSVDDAVAFYKSKAWTDLAPERDKFEKVIRRYVVEVEK